MPAFRQDVHTVIRRRVPGATIARTVCTLGFHRRWVRRCECETDIPKPGLLPQTSQMLATVDSLDDAARGTRAEVDGFPAVRRAT